MDFNDQDSEMQPEKRNTFLTVLCILTFVGSGWAIMTAATSYFTAEATAKVFNQTFKKNPADSAAKVDTVSNQVRKNSTSHQIGFKVGKSMKKMMTVDNIHKKAIGDLIAGLCTLGGAILMWFQRKKGFYLYIVGVAIGIAVPFYLYGNDLVSIGISSFGAFFGLLFIALYAVNLKSLYK
ncbi:MAG: hypothetical protein ABIP35_04105 [Ginsengibacter sp.]